MAAADESLPLGDPVSGWTPVERPRRGPMRGRHVLLRPLDAAADAPSLYAASHPPAGDAATWTYLPYGPYGNPGDLRDDLEAFETSDDPLFFTAVTDRGPSGVASYLRITPEHGAIEVGHIWFGAGLKRTPAATEAIYLLARHAFDELGYRRLEWKCDARNAASRRAAGRFGFTFEGVFRKQQVVKGRNRDTAWYAIVDDDWPRIRAAFEAWLAPGNFDSAGRQRTRLAAQFRPPSPGVGPQPSGIIRNGRATVAQTKADRSAAAKKGAATRKRNEQRASSQASGKKAGSTRQGRAAANAAGDAKTKAKGAATGVASAAKAAGTAAKQAGKSVATRAGVAKATGKKK